MSDTNDKSDLKVVLQFFIVPLGLVAVLVLVFFGLQFMRSRRPDPAAVLRRLDRNERSLFPWMENPKRWQSGYDLSLLLRAEEGRDPGLVPQMVESFRAAGPAGDLELRRYLALALGRRDDPRAAAALREALADPDAHVRLFAAWGLAQVGDGAAPARLRAALSDEDAGVRAVAAFALGEIDDREGAALLVRALADPEDDVRWNAALALARLRHDEAAPVLVDLLERSAFRPPGGGPEEPRTELALNAIRGLARLRDPRARSALERAAGAADPPRVRDAARVALEAGGGEP